MAQYIDKDAVVAEIKKHQAVWEGMDGDYCKGQRLAYSDVLSFIDTLEVKEVDLNKELQSSFYPHVPWGDYCKNEQKDIEEWSFKIAKHFFELGLKAQKGE